MGASSVRRWVKHFKGGNTSTEDEPRSGRPRTASTECNKERVYEIIQDDRRVTVNTVARKLGIGHSAVQEMIERLSYRKVCARWVPRFLTEDHKGQQKAINSELLQRYQHESDVFLLYIVTEGFNLAEFLEPRQTINAARYVQTLHKLRRALRDKRPGRNIIILHDNARPHATGLTLKVIAKMGWEVLPHPSYSPDLVPSDYHLFGFVTDQLRGQRFETREAIQKAVRQCLRRDGTEFYRKDPGYEQICEIEEILAGKCTELPSKKSLTVEQIAAFVHAPLSSCEVERRFSRYKDVLRDSRRRLTMENLKDLVIVNCDRI
ncbi:hypothetical protein B7P43_G11157 [Cryptotermes secundus]|uniref:Histone-lysine N-methyltransferase SETMAR n=1 Tax=Cryptotermes secundus TaxID=105785 RepID=A0A2J7R7E2_9NEOP|nr:hypothetical protein B7P43_G11157 [Cryptotermes secundus]